MSFPRTIIDTRGGPVPALPPRAPLPLLLADTRRLDVGPAGALVHGARRPPAAMPAGPEDRGVGLLVLVSTDMSGSNAWTDPRGARTSDVAYFVAWARRNLPHALLALGAFTDEAGFDQPSPPRALARDGGARRPVPGNGGTAFAPIIAAAEPIVVAHRDRRIRLVLVSDGMGPDVALADAQLRRLGIEAVLVGYGPEFPFIGAAWQHTRFKVTEHVQDRPRGIASTVAHGAVSR